MKNFNAFKTPRATTRWSRQPETVFKIYNGGLYLNFVNMVTKLLYTFAADK